MRKPKDRGATTRRARSKENWGKGQWVSEPASVLFAVDDQAVEEWKAHSAASARESAGSLIERVPHIDLSRDPPLRPGEVVDVIVYVRKQPARPGELVENVIAPTGARIEVDLVVTEHFKTKGKTTAF